MGGIEPVRLRAGRFFYGRLAIRYNGLNGRDAKRGTQPNIAAA
jgi:hypothetical protein